MNNLEKLFYFRGVSAEYLNYSAERIVVPHEIRVKLLEAVGYDVTDDEAVAQAVYELDALPWKSWLKTFNILRSGESEYLDIRVHPEEKTTSISYQITTEAGELLEGELTPAELPEVGEYYIDATVLTDTLSQVCRLAIIRSYCRTPLERSRLSWLLFRRSVSRSATVIQTACGESIVSFIHCVPNAIGALAISVT